MCYKTEINLNAAHLLSSDPVIVITTISKNGVNNAAAFGSYLRIGFTIIIAIHSESHTYKNILETKEFVVNIPGYKDLESIMRVSRAYPEGTDEIAASGLRPEASLLVKPPTIVEYPACVECRFEWAKPEGTHALVAGEMICGKCDDSYLDPVGRFDQVKAGVLHIVRYPDPVYIMADRYVQGIESME
jgi:flavin reductase (DIM6/NTAB) family NADH-FMN oxidoreductase RutF